jgi:uncharacterized protein YciI
VWYLVLSQNPKPEGIQPETTDAHLEWLADLHRSGRALFSGRTADHAYGIYVLLADNLEAGRQLAAQDPYHLTGDRTLDKVLEWNPQRAMRMDVTIADLEAMATGKKP